MSAGSRGPDSEVVAARASERYGPAFLIMGVQVAGLVVVLAARHFGVVAREPVWAYGGAIVGSSMLSRRLDRWVDAPRGSWRLHVRVFVHAATVMTVIYLTGWGPALGVCFVYASLADLLQSGPASWRAVLGWSLVCCAAGQLLVFVGWMPSFLSSSAAQSLGFLEAFAFGIVIAMAGAVGEQKKRTEDRLARSEAVHREVVENAAEGMYMVAADGTLLSFNAAAEAMFGWTESEVLGRPAAITITPDLHEPLARYLDSVRATGHGIAHRRGVEVTGVRRDGSRFPMMVSLSTVAVPDGPPMISSIVRDLTEQKQIEEQLAHLGFHDALTGLPNRAMLADRLDQACTRTRRTLRMCGVLYVDLDRFKVVNDNLGHAAGDLLLVEAAKRIAAAVRDTDTVARLGGDEFVVLCEDLDGVQHAAEVAQRIITALQFPFQLGDDDAHVSASIGIALSVDGTEAADEFLANADIAMYRAKQHGRSRYELFDAAMQQWVASQAALEAALRHAVSRNELRLYYQPIIGANDGSTHGFEALLRWERPGYGLVPPDDFIPIAEDSGLISDIGAWVLEEACRQAATWAQCWPERRLGISVNVSSRQLCTGDLTDAITSTLARHGLDPELLTLELTESTLIEDAVSTQTILRDLRAIGVNISLDDFGTGYSSLTHLRSFPINYIKIDKSFVRTIGTEREDTAIVAAVLALARNLDITVVAEGVETNEQLAVLVELQCPYLQGHLFSRPIPAGDVDELIQTPQLNPATCTNARTV